MHDGEILAEVKGFKVIECDSCGFKHLMPIPSKERIARYYENKYYQEKKAKLLDPEKEIREQSWLNLSYRDKLEVFNEHVKRIPKRILDVGCGNGYFLKYMKDNSWEEIGVEPSPMASSYAESLGVKVFNTTLEDFEKKRWYGFFNAINLKYVLEHVPLPRKILEICKRLLSPGGMICVTVPNDFNPLQLHVQEHINTNKNPWWIAIPDHINYFNFLSIEKLMVSVGFKTVLITTDFPMEMFLLMGENYLDNDDLGSICHKKRMNFELSMSNENRRAIYHKLSQIGIGRSCILYSKLESTDKT